MDHARIENMVMFEEFVHYKSKIIYRIQFGNSVTDVQKTSHNVCGIIYRSAVDVIIFIQWAAFVA